MYAGVDIGGSKTLAAVLDESGTIIERVQFPTPKKYDEFLAELSEAVSKLKTKDFRAAGIAVPGLLNREHGLAISLGNLPWENEHVQADCEKIFKAPVVIENDAKLAALSEAMLHKDAETVLYVTVSTGIGIGVVHNQHLDPALLNSEAGHMMVPHRGKLKKWESFASGKAIYEHFGKKAKDITAEGDWKLIARNLAVGLFETIAIVQPNLIIVGGSVGTHFAHYGKYLVQELKKYEVPVVSIPPIIQAQRPEEAVVYGCYDLAKQRYPGHSPVVNV
jgi:predicted NBD/HSP70 family sugar kinase